MEGKPFEVALPEPGRDDLPAGFEALIATLDQLSASKTFSRSAQLKRLLLYLRDSAATSDPTAWSETAIGVQAFGRKDFNPKLDTIVRVEMRRLRQKLDEYYASEGLDFPLRLRFEKNTYRPYVEPNVLPPAEVTPPADLAPAVELAPIELAPVEPKTDRLWMGVWFGAGAMALIALLAAGIWSSVAGAADRAPREIAESPIWSGFRSTNVVIAIGTPLFFRSSQGFERNYKENLSEDLPLSDDLLAWHPAYPVWNLWAPFDDIGASVALDRFLHSLSSTATVVSARQMSYGGLAGKRTIVMGQPRQTPLLQDLLADQNFRAPPHVAGHTFAGFVNSAPKPDEAQRFPGGSGTLLMQSDESNPDWALVTSIRLANGGEVLNVFGDRAQTGAFVARKLTDPAFVAEMDARVFQPGKNHRSAQVVFRVDYSRSAPTGLVYVTHRVTYADRK
jgi:hypothetical protein